jgi:uncharacterized membrane protein
MTILNLFNTEIGAKARAALVALVAIVTAVSLFLQSVLDVLNVLPSTGATATVGSLIVGAITFLGRFTKVGDKA